MTTTTQRHSWRDDLKILYHLALRPVRGASHAERMDRFYQGQASGYDAFRRRLLRGREELFSHTEIPEHGVWIDMGAGTGENAVFAGDQRSRAKHVYLVDLSSSLLDVAEQRITANAWTNVSTAHTDVLMFSPTEPHADLITFSYSLTMIPDWFAALDHAHRLLRPGGFLGVVDFFVARKHPGDSEPKHSWAARNLWPLWFANDNVFLSQDHIPYLNHRLECVHFSAHHARVPYMFGLKVPYYIFVGRKR
jgi:S-adenosylmethionine-diacylgycerolhomoserine-N-methlytransferase